MKKLTLGLILAIIFISITGCDSATTVSGNLSKEANEFKVKRRITFINLRTNEYLFQVTGNCSVKGGRSDINREVQLICRIGEDKYQKHFLSSFHPLIIYIYYTVCVKKSQVFILTLFFSSYDIKIMPLFIVPFPYILLFI